MSRTRHFMTRSTGAGTGTPFTREAIVACLLLLGLLACSKAPTGPQHTEPSILLISLDTLRADHLGVDGYHSETSPGIDRLAQDSVVFDRAIAQCSHTRDSHMSLMRSRYPTRTGEQAPYLAEVLQGRGYRTAAFTGGGFVAASFGFGTGFEIYEEIPQGFRYSLPEAQEWLDDLGPERPFFVFLHSYDVHAPYDPQPPFDTFYEGTYQGPLVPARTSTYQRQYLGLDPPNDEFRAIEWNQADRRRFESLYDGCIKETDSYLQELLKYLDSSPSWSWDRDILVILSDHGEEFWDHDSVGHGHTLYQELIRVPLLIRLPGAAHRGQRITETVELMDLAPTLLELTGIEIPPSFTGQSFQDLLAGGPRQDRSNIAVSLTVGNQRSIIVYPWKLILKQKEVQLFDLENDPTESSSVADQHPKIVQRLRRLLRKALNGKVGRKVILKPETIEDPALLEQLQVLGYVGADDTKQTDQPADTQHD